MRQQSYLSLLADTLTGIVRACTFTSDTQLSQARRKVISRRAKADRGLFGSSEGVSVGGNASICRAPSGAEWKACSSAALNIPANYNDIRIVRDGFSRLPPDGDTIFRHVMYTSSERVMPTFHCRFAPCSWHRDTSASVRPAGDADNSMSTDLDNYRDLSTLSCSFVQCLRRPPDLPYTRRETFSLRLFCQHRAILCVLCLFRQVQAPNDASLLYHKLFSLYVHIPRRCSSSSLSP